MVTLALAANTHPVLRRAHGLYWIVTDISKAHYAVSAETSDRIILMLVLPMRARLGQTPHVAPVIGTSSALRPATFRPTFCSPDKLMMENGFTPMTITQSKKISACPSWLELSEDRRSFVYLEDRAEIIRKIFELSIGGLGSYAITNFLEKQGIPPFGSSPKWDHTTIDSMLRNRAVLGEYQPKSYAGGRSKGIPTGPPVPDYYPAVIDEDTFQKAQAARQQNLMTSRGRKGNDLANLFDGLTTCAYCGSEVRFLSSHPYKSLVCAKVLDENGCTKTAWSYQDFEANVLQFLAHPALLDSAEPSRKDELRSLVGHRPLGRRRRPLRPSLLHRPKSQKDRYAAYAFKQRGYPGESSGGCSCSTRRQRTVYELCLWDSAIYKGISTT